MEKIIVSSEDQLVSLIESAVGKILKVEPPKGEIDRISGIKAAAKYLNTVGYSISHSQFAKLTAKGLIPCRKFQGRGLLFSKKELVTWAESKCTPVGQSNAVLMLAKSALRKR